MNVQLQSTIQIHGYKKQNDKISKFLIRNKKHGFCIGLFKSVFLFILILSTYMQSKAQGNLYNVDTHQVGYTDYVIPGTINKIKLFVAGGSGGDVTSDDTYCSGRTGGGSPANITATFPVSFCSTNDLQPGGLLRLVVGETGSLGFLLIDKVTSSAGAGGGGSAVLYQPPGSSVWRALIISGGGGGAAVNTGLIGRDCFTQTGGNAQLGENGGNGGGDHGGAGGTGGNGGSAGGIIAGDGGGGGGRYSDGAYGAISGIGGHKGDPAGGNGGERIYGYVQDSKGGFGFGGGGAANSVGGGGGGYSGGGGGSNDGTGSGGGGGSYIDAAASNVQANIASDNSHIKVTLTNGTPLGPIFLLSSTLPALQVYGCTANDITSDNAGLAYSPSGTSITLAQFNAAGGAIAANSCNVQSIFYQDVIDPNDSKKVIRTFTVTDTKNNTAIATQVIAFDSTAISVSISPSSQSVCINATPQTIIVDIKTQYPVTLQWYSGPNAIFSNSTLISGEVSSTYSPPASSITDVTYYFARILGGCAGAIVKNSKVTVVSTAPSITTNVSTTPNIVTNAVPPVLSVVATGSGLTYQWYLNTINSNMGGVAVTSGSGGQSANYTPDVATNGTNYYYVIISGACGTSRSTVATVTVSQTVVPDVSGIAYVKVNGSGNLSGNSWSNATGDLQRAINGTNVQKVWVAKGSYYPDKGLGKTVGDRNASFLMKNEVAIYGGFAGTESSLGQRNLATNPTILSGDIGNVGSNADNSFNVVSSPLAYPSARLDGFTISGGNANSGIFDTDRGGGLHNGDDASPTIANCIFIANLAQFGGAIYNRNNTTPTIINCLFTGNNAVYDGSGVFNEPTATTIVINCTFYGNTGSAVITNYSAPAVIQNCIIWGNNNGVSGNATVSNSDVQGGASGTGNLNTDPLFMDAGNSNFHLQAISPCINKGNDLANTEVIDLDGNTRNVGVIDMGVYENNGCPAGNVLYVKANATGTNNGSSWSNAFTNLQDALNQSCPGVTQIWVSAGTYYPDEGVGITLGDRASTFNMKSALAIYGGFAGTETLLSQRDSTRATNNTILSGDIGTVGVNTDNAYHVVVSAGIVGSATLNGFTVQGGYADGVASNVINGVSIAENRGGGIAVTSSNPAISNVSIVGNYGADAGGLYNNLASPVFTNMIISSNTASSYGGAMYNNYSTPVFNNMIVSGNSAGVSGAGICNFASSPLITNTLISGNASTWAAGLYNVQSSNSVLTNVTISGNNAINNGSGIYNESGSSPLIRNSIIYGNKDGIVNADGTCVPLFTYSLVQGGLQSGTGNIDGDTHDPGFVSSLGFASSPVTGGDYHLLNSTSAANNSGNNIYFNVGQVPDLSAITLDLDGNPRKTGVIDMGPYELLSALPVSLVNFTAQQAGSQSKLTWSTTREVNNKSFIISRSADGSNFTEIGKVNAQGNSVNQSDYIFYDQSPLRGNNYYKLEQVDNDGRKTLAGIRLVNFARASPITLYPNPVRNNLVIEFTEGLYDHIQLTDISGKVLKVFVPGKINSQQKINMSNLASGTYFLQFIGNDKMETRKVVKE